MKSNSNDKRTIFLNYMSWFNLGQNQFHKGLKTIISIQSNNLFLIFLETKVQLFSQKNK